MKMVKVKIKDSYPGNSFVSPGGFCIIKGQTDVISEDLYLSAQNALELVPESGPVHGPSIPSTPATPSSDGPILPPPVPPYSEAKPMLRKVKNNLSGEITFKEESEVDFKKEKIMRHI